MSKLIVERKVVAYKRDLILKECHKQQRALDTLQSDCPHPAKGLNPVRIDPDDPTKRVGFKCPDCYKIWTEVVESI